MRLILLANTMEHPELPEFIKAARACYPDAAFLVCGDLLNVFPEPGENLRDSIFYQLHGELLVNEMDALAKSHFAKPHESKLIEPLRSLFTVEGRDYHRGESIARTRYARVFADLQSALGNQHLYFIPGNMDYPLLSAKFATSSRTIHQLDGSRIDTPELSLGGIGGIPRSAHPFHDLVAISPYEMDDDEYERRLQSLWGVKTLVTHLSPQESPALRRFLRDSPVELLICRAPFDFSRTENFRGESKIEFIEGKVIAKVSPFAYPCNDAYVLDLPAGNTDLLSIDIFSWYATIPSQQYTSPESRSHALA